jgi:multiple sugar transport system ATP-binding protein
MAPGMASRAGQLVILGIRPEHISPTPAGLRSGLNQSIEATVERVQQMGGETCLNLAAGPHWMVARLPAANGAPAKCGRSFVVDMRHAHFFDPLTEKRVGGESVNR